ncbi:MAG: methylmalonyl-CoA mutase [Nitrospinota bacterium]
MSKQEGLFDSADIKDLEYDRDIGLPGEYPYTRGIYPTMYRGRLWTMRQYAGYGTADESNKRFRSLLKSGETGLSIAFDLPTQMGYDSDHPLARGEVGRVGVSIDSLKDMERLLLDIPLDKISTSMTINATSPVILAMYISAAEGRGIEIKGLRGTIQNDILKEYIARGTYIFPPGPSIRITTDIMRFCRKNLPGWNPISISGYHMREAGASTVQELAFTIANGITYVEAAIESGLKIDDFAPRLSFFFSVHNNFLEEIAKFRAARRIWAGIMKERLGAKKGDSQRMKFHVQTAGCTLTARQPENNIVRVTLQALAAILGGAQSLHTNSKDEAFAIPTEGAVRLALHTQHILAEESGIANTADPLGGSYAVEALTNKIEEEVKALLKRIDSEGGMLRAIEKGFIRREIEESSYRHHKSIENKERIVVGVNEFVNKKDAAIERFSLNPDIEERQMRNLERLRRDRDISKVNTALNKVKDAARKGDNIMPPVIEAVKVYATIGEISDAMREVFGEFRYNSHRGHRV